MFFKCAGKLLCAVHDAMFETSRYCQIAADCVSKTNYVPKQSLSSQKDILLPSIQAFQERRFRLMVHIATRAPRKIKNHLVVIPSSTKCFMSEHIPYPFRQSTDFLYLSGFKEPDCALVLHTEEGKYAPEHKSVLFVPKISPYTERWEGRKLNISDAQATLGVDSAFYFEELENYLYSYAAKTGDLMFWYDYLSSPFLKLHGKIRSFLSTYNNLTFESPQSLIHKLRLYKSAEEMEFVKRSCLIASESMLEVMKFSYGSVPESHLQARMEYECRLRGADCLAFPPVVAGSDRANTIHYISNNDIVHNGEMVLMDAGCEYHGYSSDLTRTWPVSGRFSEAQRELYEIVYTVQEELIQLCNSFPSLDYLFNVMCKSIGSKLQDIGIIPANASKDEASKVAYEFCPHHVSHYLGMDVHDTSCISRGINMQPGMVITLEPGIYIRKNDLHVPEKYRGLCVRIEDDIYIDDNGPQVLTSTCPKKIEDIESVMSGSS